MILFIAIVFFICAVVFLVLYIMERGKRIPFYSMELDKEIKIDTTNVVSYGSLFQYSGSYQVSRVTQCEIHLMVEIRFDPMSDQITLKYSLNRDDTPVKEAKDQRYTHSLNESDVWVSVLNQFITPKFGGVNEYKTHARNVYEQYATEKQQWKSRMESIMKINMHQDS